MAHGFDPRPELSEVATRLWRLDENYCNPGIDYDLDLGGYVTSTRNYKDWAKEKLFTWVDEELVFSDERPTYKAFRALLDNYETETGKAEEITEQEEHENWHFLHVIMETAPMKEVHSYLTEKGKASADVDEFKDELYKMWFKLYKRERGRERILDSSGFEHVFVGESRNQQVLGFHNWIQFYLQEKKGNIDYRGYFRRGTDESDEDYPRLITLQFTWTKAGGSKPIGSSFIGTSPEFEVALYTLVHMMDEGDKVPLDVDGYMLEVHAFPHGRFGIGTAYPVSKCD